MYFALKSPKGKNKLNSGLLGVSAVDRCAAHLFRGKDGDEILVYLTNLLLDHSLIGFLLELLAGHPEHHVLLAELRPQELPEAAAPRRAFHHLLKGRGPGAGLFQSRPRTDGTTKKIAGESLFFFTEWKRNGV